MRQRLLRGAAPAPAIDELMGNNITADLAMEAELGAEDAHDHALEAQATSEVGVGL
jgi:hypothetical protein